MTRTRAVHAEKRRSYPVRLADGGAVTCGPAIADIVRDRRLLVVTTPTVARLYGAAIDAAFLRGRRHAAMMVLACDEATKNIETVLRISQRALDVELDRQGLLIGIGGGVCLDMVALAASLTRRGIDHVRIPTTLLGQVDAGIGVKCAVNLGRRKSFLGAYQVPSAAVIAPAFLQTLPLRHARSGLAEIIKMAIIDSEPLFELVESHYTTMLGAQLAEPAASVADMVWSSASLMLDHLEPNLHEDRTYRRHVDFGHTFSPVLEAASGFSITHGEAVAVDVALSTVIARGMGLVTEGDERRILALLSGIGLPIHSRLLDAALCLRAIDEAAQHRGGSPNLVVPRRIGETVFIEDSSVLPASLMAAAIARVERMAQEFSMPQEAVRTPC